MKGAASAPTPPLAAPSIASAAGVEIRWTFCNPAEELGQMRMAAQRLNGGIVAGDFGLAQGGVDFFVANVVQQNGWSAFPAFQLWRQVMAALRHFWRYLAQAQRAYRQGIGHVSYLPACSARQGAAREG